MADLIWYICATFLVCLIIGVQGVIVGTAKAVRERNPAAISGWITILAMGWYVWYAW